MEAALLRPPSSILAGTTAFKRAYSIVREPNSGDYMTTQHSGTHYYLVYSIQLSLKNMGLKLKLKASYTDSSRDQRVIALTLLVKRSITSRTCLNIRTPQDPPSTCWQRALRALNSLRQSVFGHLYIFWLWKGLFRWLLRPGRVLNVLWHRRHS